MATYPAYTQHRSSKSKRLDDVQIDRAGNGMARARAFYPATKYEFEIIHPALTRAERATLDAFYTTNRLLPVDLYSPETGATHSVLFDGAPQFEPLGANLFRTLVKLQEI